MPTPSSIFLPVHLEPAAPGGLSKVLRSVFMKPATVTGIERIGERFYIVSLHSAKFEQHAWVAGQKLQIAMGTGLMSRTYTPIDWDARAGVTRILAYAHGCGPGSDWLAKLKVGDICDVFGPRSSLDLRRVSDSVVILGDETSIGLAYAMFHESQGKVQAFLEVDDVESTRRVVEHLQFHGVQLVSRGEDDVHLAEIETQLDAFAAEGASFVLTGNAASIQRLRRKLKSAGVAAARLLSKAYWAQGKKGLD